MWLLFVLQLLSSLEGLFGVEPETLCSSNVCLRLQVNKVSFEVAAQSCIQDGGHLMTVRERGDEDELRLLLSRVRGQPQDRQMKFWIGLKLHRGDCVLSDRTLRGFVWVSGERESHYSNWAKDPVITCTEERCVSVHYTSSGQDLLRWTAGSCKRPAFYVCKFIFKGMCKPLTVFEPGQVNYTAPFSQEPLRSEMPLYPLGTFADISCDDRQPQYSVCAGTEHTYHWTVPGPFCRTEKQSCAVNNGGCEHFCGEDADVVRCFCKDGYSLEEDGRTCTLMDLCRSDTCEHQCVMGESGYSCTCPQGFRLSENQHNCSDVDECRSMICEQHLCINSRGSYSCVCKDGYKMVDGQCVDTDECLQPKCEHSCVNSVGSFYCRCNEGFILSADGHSCADINECASNICHYKCFNTVGSFFCTCQQGFTVDTDGFTCTPDETADNQTTEETQTDFTDLLSKVPADPQHQSHHTQAPLVNVTYSDRHTNTSLVTSATKTSYSRVIICVLGSLIPLLLLLAVTLAIAIYRCAQSQKQAKKNTTTDGYCWVSSGFDPRLEKLYESILTDDL